MHVWCMHVRCTLTFLRVLYSIYYEILYFQTTEIFGWLKQKMIGENVISFYNKEKLGESALKVITTLWSLTLAFSIFCFDFVLLMVEEKKCKIYMIHELNSHIFCGKYSVQAVLLLLWALGISLSSMFPPVCSYGLYSACFSCGLFRLDLIQQV